MVGAVEKFNITYPVMMDNDYAYWNALNNRYWPSFYLVSKKGIIQKGVYGEVHEGTERARVLDEVIEMLLDEA